MKLKLYRVLYNDKQNQPEYVDFEAISEVEAFDKFHDAWGKSGYKIVKVECLTYARGLATRG